MTDSAADQVSLDPQTDDTYLLTRIAPDGQRSEIVLSDANMLALAQSAERIRDHIHAKRTPKSGGHPPVTVTPVGQCQLSTDIHVTEVHIEMIGRNGARQWYSLPLEVAKAVAEALPRFVQRIEAAAAEKKVQ